MKRGDTVWDDGVGAPVEELDAALLASIEAAVLTPQALQYVLDGAATLVRKSLDGAPERLRVLEERQADLQRRISRLVDAVEDGGSRSLRERIAAHEADLVRIQAEIAATQARAQLAQFNTARALRDLAPTLVN